MELEDGQTLTVRGSSGSVYELKNVGGVYSCSCPAWRNQSRPFFERSCKHLRELRGAEAESARIGAEGPSPATAAKAAGQGPPVLLAHSWDQMLDLTGWWMSEKLDGVRAYWDGKRLLSRLGNAFVAPQWFLAGLPDHPLDGELWGGRRMFQRTVSIVRRQDASQEWRKIQYLVFDAPAAPGSFEERLEVCRQWVNSGVEFGRMLEHERCRGLEHLRAELARIEGEGGEGLMMRRPGSLYEAGRSWSLLKIKNFRDAEGVVVGHQPGEGRHRGRLGALLLELPDGTRFAVGTGFSDAEREQPPALGELVTFRYQELSEAGVPRFPTYVGVRIDMQKGVSSMKVMQVGLGEACDLQSQGGGPRLAQLLGALHAYAGGSRKEINEYIGAFPFSRLKEVWNEQPVPARPSTAPKAPPPPSAAPAPAAEGFRRFEFSEGSSNKFWEVAQNGCDQTVRFGRLGTAGQTKSKTFANEAEAQRDTEKLIAEKVAKGYEPVQG